MVANTPRSRKARGRRAQQEVRDALRAKYIPKEGLPNSLVPGDIESRQMGGSGTDIVLSPRAKSIIPYDIEVKCQESLSIWDAINQCETNTEQGRIPLLCFRRNHTEMYACLKLSDLLRLTK